MTTDEIKLGHAVAVHQQDVAPLRRRHAQVAHARSGEAHIRVPDVHDRQAQIPRGLLHRLLVRWCGAVVCHHHFKAPVVLRGQATQHRKQRIAAVVGGDDDGDQVGWGHLWTRLKRLPSALASAQTRTFTRFHYR